MRYYGGEGPITALRNAGIGILANTAGSYLTQLLTQKRLESMFNKQTEVGSLVDMLKGRSESDYQSIAPQIESKLQEQGLFKSGLPKITAEGFRPAGGSPTDRLMPLPEVYSTGAGTNQAFDIGTGSKYIQPTEDIKTTIGRMGTRWLESLPEPQKSEVLKSAIAPKNAGLAEMIALMGLQLKQGGQAFNQDLAGQKLGLDQQKFGLQQQDLGLKMQNLQQQINKSKETNARLTSLEDLSSRRTLDSIVGDMNKYYQAGDIESAKKSMDQANSLIQKHPNLGITPYNLEEPSTLGEKFGVKWLPDIKLGSPKITGGKATAPSAGKTIMTPEQAQAELIKQGYVPDGKGGWVKK